MYKKISIIVAHICLLFISSSSFAWQVEPYDQARDYEQVVQLHRDSIAWFNYELYKDEYRGSEITISWKITDEQTYSAVLRNYQVLVARAGSQVIGLIATAKQDPLPSTFILRVATHRDFQRQGVASALLEAAFESLKAQGESQVTISVLTSNIPAQKLYEKIGFVSLFPSLPNLSSQVAILGKTL